MTTYNKDQEYTLKVVNTDNEVKEIKYTPDKNMSKPEMIMALKAKYKNFFKLIESKLIESENTDIISKLNNLKDEFMSNLYKDKDKANEVKEQVKQVLQDAPDGTALYRLYKETSSGWTSHGSYYDERTVVHEYKKENGIWTMCGRKKNTIDDAVMSVLYNEGKFMTKEEAEAKRDEEKVNDMSSHRDIVNVGTDSAGNPIGKSTNRVDYPNKKTEEYFVCSRCLRGIDLDYNVEDYVIDPKTGEEMCRNCAEEAGIITDDELDENIEIEKHREDKLNKLQADIIYNFEEAYKDWGKEVSDTKSGFVDEYMSEYCNDYEDEINWKDYIVAIPELDKIYAEYKDVEDWEIPDDIKWEQYELITDYVQNYLKGMYNKVEESKNTINEKSLSDFLGNIDNAWSLDITQTKSNGNKVYVVKRLANSKYTAEDIKNKIKNEFGINGDITSDNKEIWLSNKKIESKSTDDNSVIVISYGKGTRFPDRQTAIDYYKECVAGTDPNGSENYSCQNILYELMYTDKDVVYDIDDQTEYDWWVQKGKPTEDISDELLKAHLGESKNMKKEDLSKEEIEELDNYTDNEIKKMYDKYCSENKDKKSFEEWQKENVDSALINELEYEFFSNRKKTEDLDIDDKVYEDGFVGQPLSMVLSYIGDGHDIADNDYDGCVVFFPPVDEIDDTDNYDLYVQGLSQILKVTERFDVDDINIVVDIADYVKKNKDTLLDLFEVDGETDDEIMEDLVCRVMPNVISGYTTDSVYKLLLNTVKGGK